MPYFDSSGWFLIEKTTILTNSCCLYVQPTFGYEFLLWESRSFPGSNEACPWLDEEPNCTFNFFKQNLTLHPGENGLRKSRVRAHRLNISAKLFREN